MTGKVILSIEVELAWGLHDLEIGETLLSEDGQCERKYLSKLLDELDESSVPCTFDVVGHLCLEECSGEHTGPHPAGWFTADPGTDSERSPLYYGPDLIGDIKTRRVEHEISTHTFSHSIRTENAAELSWELEQVARIDPSQLSSFVSPRHGAVDYNVLSEYGIRSIRVPVYKPRSVAARKLNALSRALPRQSPPVCDASVTNGMIETYSTYEPSLTSPLLPNGGRSAPFPFRYLPLETRQHHHERYLKRGVEKAIDTGSTVHYWTHLYNLANPAQSAPVASFIKWLGEKRRSGDIMILTMGDLGSGFQ